MLGSGDVAPFITLHLSIQQRASSPFSPLPLPWRRDLFQADPHDEGPVLAGSGEKYKDAHNLWGEAQGLTLAFSR